MNEFASTAFAVGRTERPLASGIGRAFPPHFQLGSCAALRCARQSWHHPWPATFPCLSGFRLPQRWHAPRGARNMAEVAMPATVAANIGDSEAANTATSLAYLPRVEPGVPDAGHRPDAARRITEQQAERCRVVSQRPVDVHYPPCTRRAPRQGDEARGVEHRMQSHAPRPGNHLCLVSRACRGGSNRWPGARQQAPEVDPKRRQRPTRPAGPPTPAAHHHLAPLSWISAPVVAALRASAAAQEARLQHRLAARSPDPARPHLPRLPRM